MSRRTVDFGIDLGTTNSAIALLDGCEIKVLKNSHHSEITPSVVRIDEENKIIVGQNALSQLYADSENTCIAFKLLMGTRQVKSFARSGRIMKPEELSAEVLKDLKATVGLRMPSEPDVTTAVITVPCYFEMTQSQATLRAAKLAGIEFAPLLQEPIAASIAYGFLEKMPKGYWIVYDLGGGTFDVALLSARDGHLIVVDHDGDNYLGGTDFDWRIVEDIIYPALRQQYHLPDLARLSKYSLLNVVLKRAAEEAKIRLSQNEKTEILVEGTDNLKDQDGKLIQARIPCTRQQLNLVIEEDVDKSLRLFRNVLKNQKLSAADIEHLILVGGPTQIPYIRECLKNEFNIPVNCTIDPMNVVAKGAAIYAATQLLPVVKSQKDNFAISLELKYDPMTTALETGLGGKMILSGIRVLPAGVKVQIFNAAGDWQSGLLEIKNNTFFTMVLLQAHCVNTFVVRVFDEKGNLIPVEGETFSINQGMSVGARLWHGLLALNCMTDLFDRLLNKGVFFAG